MKIWLLFVVAGVRISP